MSVDTLAPVKSALAGWYKQFQLENDPAQIEARLDGITAVTLHHAVPQIEALVRLAFASKRPASTAELERIREAFTKADESFPQTGNAKELQVLAAACLVQLMEKNPSLTALAISTTSCGSARKPKLPMDLAGRAANLLESRSEINRNRKSVPTTFLESDELDFSVVQNKIRTQPDWNALADGMGEIESSIREAFADQASQVKIALDTLVNNVKMKDEELDMLWWLTGNRSEDLDCSFESIPADQQPFVLAKELAGMTTFLPGPASAKALLSRAGLKDRKKIKLTDAVSAISNDWAQAYVQNDEYSPVTTPIHFALHRRMETDGGDDWIANWSSVTGIKADFETSTLMLGLHFYRERLLLKWS